MDADLKKALILGLALSQDSYQEEEIEDPEEIIEDPGYIPIQFELTRSFTLDREGK